MRKYLAELDRALKYLEKLDGPIDANVVFLQSSITDESTINYLVAILFDDKYINVIKYTFGDLLEITNSGRVHIDSGGYIRQEKELEEKTRQASIDSWFTRGNIVISLIFLFIGVLIGYQGNSDKEHLREKDKQLIKLQHENDSLQRVFSKQIKYIK